MINPDAKLVEELEKITAKVRDLSGRINEKVEIKTCIGSDGEVSATAAVGEYSFEIFFGGDSYLTYKTGIRETVKPETVRFGKEPSDW